MPNDIEALKARLREEIARIIDPIPFSMTPEHYDCTPEDFKRTMAYGGQLAALEKADAILALALDEQSARIQELEGVLGRISETRETRSGTGVFDCEPRLTGHQAQAIAFAALNGGDRK